MSDGAVFADTFTSMAKEEHDTVLQLLEKYGFNHAAVTWNDLPH